MPCHSGRRGKALSMIDSVKSTRKRIAKRKTKAKLRSETAKRVYEKKRPPNKYPPLLVAVLRDGEIDRYIMLADPREEFCKAFNELNPGAIEIAVPALAVPELTKEFMTLAFEDFAKATNATSRARAK